MERARRGWQNYDYRKTLIVAHLGWWGTAAFAVLRAFEVIPVSFGSFGLLTLGVGVSASLALSRMRLAETITQVFQTGLHLADYEKIAEEMEKETRG